VSGIIPQQCGVRGAVLLAYPADGIQNGPADGFALVNPAGTVVEFLSYEGVVTATNGLANGLTSTGIGVSEPGTTPIGQSLARNAAGTWTGPQAMSYNSCNANGPVPPPNFIRFTGRETTDIALPVGFQDQLFATEVAGLGGTITTTFTWSSDTPAIASVDDRGVITGLAAGDAVIRATAQDGTTGTITLAIAVPQPGPNARYIGNAAFGIPADGNASDDIIITRDEFTASFNPVRNIPNWVSYNLDGDHIMDGQDRCDCFTYDPLLPANLTRYTTADYTGGGAALGLPQGETLDRGHLARSADRTDGALDNARTYYFTNIIPQFGVVNQGPWARFETYLGDLADDANKELYIITGATGAQGTVKDEGVITIPEWTWKVAVIMDRNRGLADVDGLEDLEVIAVVMPNVRTVSRGAPWEGFRVTVDSVESLSGYDVLALLRDDLEIAIESETAFPVAAVDGPYAQLENLPIAMSGAASTDADNDALTYAWSFGDGATATGASVSHAYAAAGQYTVRLIVRDTRGLADTITTTATIRTPAQGLGEATAAVQELIAAGRLNRGQANSLQVSIDAAIASLGRGNETAAANQLEALRNKVAAMVQSRRLTAGEASALLAVIEQVLASIAG
jgi:DNA/RNA endonuclease G (NUC1)